MMNSAPRPWFGLAAALSASMIWCGWVQVSWAGEAPPPAGYTILESFSAPAIPEDGIRVTVDRDKRKAGYASVRVSYGGVRNGWVRFSGEGPEFAGKGSLRLWIFGDGSQSRLEPVVESTIVSADPRARPDRPNVPGILLDFEGWREVTVSLDTLPANRRYRIRGFRVRPSKKCAAASAPEECVFWMDDLRYVPAATGGTPAPTVATGLLGSRTRILSDKLQAYVDAANFDETPLHLEADYTVTDRNDVTVTSQQWRRALTPGERGEWIIDIDMPNAEAFLPPFRVTGEVRAPDFPSLSSRFDFPLVLGNSRMLFDDGDAVYARWFTAGFPEINEFHRWWVFAENQRASAVPQTAMRLDRAEVEPAPPSGDRPARGRHALHLAFRGEGYVWNGAHRRLPGQPYRFGVWVKGDGSGAALEALFVDYSSLAGMNWNEWKRIEYGLREVAILDFTDWRYCEIDLPGDGLGVSDGPGSTKALDYPLELSYLRIRPSERGKKEGECWIGSMYVSTQQSQAGSLKVLLGYGDPNQDFGINHNAWIIVQNGWRGKARDVEITWELTDRDGKPVANGRMRKAIEATRRVTIPLDAKVLAAAADRPGPLRLSASASDTENMAVHAQAAMMLSKPDSNVLLSDFEMDRGYLGLRPAHGVPDSWGPRDRFEAYTSTEEAHEGKRSLALSWHREDRPVVLASIDPPLRGEPTEIRLWVHGDGSGVLLYPFVGDREGVNHAYPENWFDLFAPRFEGTPDQNVVHVDWKGWREIRFRLPLVPPSWAEDRPVRGFVPSYPLGLHISVRAEGAAAEKGTVYVDDIRYVTHLPANERLRATLLSPSLGNVRQPGATLHVRVTNSDLCQARTFRLEAGLANWLDESIGQARVEKELPPGGRADVAVSESLPAGAFQLQAALFAGQEEVQQWREDLVVADLAPLFGSRWREALTDEWALRRAAGLTAERLTADDWDWVEHYPGNPQFQTWRDALARTRERGLQPMGFLGFCAYWAAGMGLELREAGAFRRPPRDVGHTVNVYQVPARLDDWDRYTQEMMRNLGGETAAWFVWNRPDKAEGSTAVPPDKFSAMLRSASRWRDRYCPDVPLCIGDLGRGRALPYLEALAKEEGLAAVDGVSVQMDLGRLSPEDARLAPYLSEVAAALRRGHARAARVAVNHLDWAVEKTGGVDAFDQAALLARAEILLRPLGVHSFVRLQNEDAERLGTGLVFRSHVEAPPLRYQPRLYNLKPAYWGLLRIRALLRELSKLTPVAVQDRIPGQTRCMVGTAGNGDAVAVLWRQGAPGLARFDSCGLTVSSAADLFGSELKVGEGGYPVGPAPCVFRFRDANDLSRKLACLPVSEADGTAMWAQSPVAVFHSGDVKNDAYEQEGGAAATLEGRTGAGEEEAWPGLRFTAGGRETLTLSLPPKAGVVLRQRIHIGEKAPVVRLAMNDRPVGTWDLTRKGNGLSGGLREVWYRIPSSAVGEERPVRVTATYEGPVASAGWVALAYGGEDLPLSALDPLYLAQPVSCPRAGRNVAGEFLRIGTSAYEDGVGVFAPSLLEYELAGGYRRFTATVGIDAATKGQGSVRFEVYGDGRKLAGTETVTGLDTATTIEADLTGVNRLRLVVTDAGDGNEMDAANWCDAVLSP